MAYAWYSGEQKTREREEQETALALSIPGRLEPDAKEVMARGCTMLDWIDHVELKRGEPLPANLILSDRRAPWEPVPGLEEKLAAIETEFGRSTQTDIYWARDRVSGLRVAARALRSAATNLLIAQIAVDSGSAGTAQSKFEAARKDARNAVSAAERAMAPWPTQLLESGIMMSVGDPCDAL